MKSQKKKNRKKKSLKVLHTCIILKREEIGKDRFDFAQSYINVTNINKKYMEDKIEINGNETDKKALEPFSLQPPTSLKVEENEYM